jgi:propanol-preferring alcohol dehydrogenase
MATTMKAAVVRAFGQPLAIEEVPVPQPGPGEVAEGFTPATGCG